MRWVLPVCWRHSWCVQAKLTMFPCASINLHGCVFLVACAALAVASEIRHTDDGVLMTGKKTASRHRLVKRQVHKGMLGFNEEQKYAILRRHNLLRSQRRASNMMMMDWDPKLEKLAQKWAENCTFEHSPGRDGAAGYNYVGENLFAGTGDFNPVGVVQAWYDEVKDYNYETGKCVSNRLCGHYTQVVWASSKALGCGVKYCDHLKEAAQYGFNHGYNVVCHYGPGGNYVGRKPFIIGEACSQCPKEATFCVQGMCALRPQIGARGTRVHNTSFASGLICISFIAFHLVLS